MRRLATTIVAVLATFSAGFFTHVLYLRWSRPAWESLEPVDALKNAPLSGLGEGQSHRVSFVPLSLPAMAQENVVDLPLLVAREVDKIRNLTGRQARIRGRVFRVGHSAKTNTYFLNFGPSREALTAVIFASSVELFEKNKLAPKNFENKDVELTGQIKDHPQFGLELILENPKQIRILD